jgi:hypothetical protein
MQTGIQRHVTATNALFRDAVADKIECAAISRSSDLCRSVLGM